MMRNDKQAAAVADRLVSLVHSKGIRFTDDGPSEEASTVIEAVRASEHVAALIVGFKATYHSAFADALSVSWGVRVDDRQQLIIACPEAKEREFLRRHHSLLADRARLRGLRDVEIVTDAPSVGLSPGESLMVLAAFDVWNQKGRVRLGEMLHRLDGVNLELIGSLIIAYAGGSSQAFDLWLETYAARGVSRG